MMSLSAISAHPISCRPQTHLQFCPSRPRNPPSIHIRNPRHFSVKSLGNNHQNPPSDKPRWEEMLSTTASLYPLHVTVGGIVPSVKPSAFSWFVKRGPSSYSCSLGLQEISNVSNPNIFNIPDFAQEELKIYFLQVMVASILVGSYMQSKFPADVKQISPFASLFAVLASALLASSYLTAAIGGFKESQRQAISFEV